MQDVIKLPEYKKILEGNVKNQLEIVNIFNENLKQRKDMLDNS